MVRPPRLRPGIVRAEPSGDLPPYRLVKSQIVQFIPEGAGTVKTHGWLFFACLRAS
jgi:hypothetical protein